MILAEIPLHYVKKTDVGGGLIHSLRIEIYLDEYALNSGHPPHFIEYQFKCLKRSEKEIPKYRRTIMNTEWHFKKFDNKQAREKFINLLRESIAQKIWTRPIMTQEALETQKHHEQNLNSGIGIRGIKQKIEINSKKNENEISNAFSDLKSLKEKSKGMVKIAASIKQKISAKEMNENEMQEI